MKLLTTDQIRKLDRATIEKEPISSLDLMERAGTRCANWLWLRFPKRTFSIVCGIGNNGGDGLVIARKLLALQSKIEVFVLGDHGGGSEDFQTNYERLRTLGGINIYTLDEESHILSIAEDNIIVDAIFGTGLSRPVEGWRADVVTAINELPNTTIAIDIPSGMVGDKMELADPLSIEADFTLTFQTPKLSFLFAENHPRVGEFHVLDIGLHQATHRAFDSKFFLTTAADARSMLKATSAFAHKGSYGQLQLVAGSKGMYGAAIMSGRAALRSGVGLLQMSVPNDGKAGLLVALPEAMTAGDNPGEWLKEIDILPKTTALAIGPGLGMQDETGNMIADLLANSDLPTVIDADGLNSLAERKDWQKLMHPGVILTPHPKEFDRLFGDHTNSFERLRTLQLKAQELDIVIILKGAYSRVALPDGSIHFNASGNAGMATAGSGDVLTGVIGSLLAQGYESHEAARLGAFIHGSSGDIAVETGSRQSLIASDLIDNLKFAWRELQ